jgi:hypothetical protein
MNTVPAIRDIALYDTVELTEAIDNAPAGSRGGVLELLDGDIAMLEITTMPLEPALDRIVFAPLAKLSKGRMMPTPLP